MPRSQKAATPGGTSDGLFRDRRDRLHRQLPGGQTHRAQRPDLRAGAQAIARSPGRAPRSVGRRRQAGHRRRRRPRQAEARRRARRTCASSRARSITSSTSRRSTTCRRRADDQQAANVDGTRNAVEFATAIDGRLLPSRELDRRRRPLRRRLSRGHVRGGRGARPSVFPHQARLRRRRAPRMQAAVSHLPARLRRRRLEDRRDRQDRRTVLLLQGSSRRCARSCRRGCRRSASRAGASTSCRSISSPTRSTTSRTRRASTASAST